MMMRRSSRVYWSILVGLLLPTSLLAESVWVSDEFEVMLRTGPNNANAIERMLSSGTALEVLEQDAESGYSRVRTQVGTEGWMLTRYLMAEPSAREQLATLSSQLSNASEEGSSLGTQLQAIRGELQSAANQIRQLEQEKNALQTEIDEVRRVAANTFEIDNQNQKLQQQLTEFEIEIGALEKQNSELGNKTARNWFLVGALVVFGGVLLGLILPRLQSTKRARYDSF